MENLTLRNKYFIPSQFQIFFIHIWENALKNQIQLYLKKHFKLHLFFI